MDIDSERAIPILIDQLAVEESQSVIRSICRALLAADVDSRMAEWLESDDPRTRCAACTVAGWAGHGKDLETMLRERLGDDDEDVVREAVKALDRWGLRQESQRLSWGILSEHNSVNRWILLDCLLALADPGEASCDWPVEDPAIGDALSPLQIDYARHSLEKLRKKLSDD